MLALQPGMERLSHEMRDRQVRLHSVSTDLELDLPPNIALPDGEEIPYGSSTRLQIRDPEQESEIYQKCIRPPPPSSSPPPRRAPVASPPSRTPRAGAAPSLISPWCPAGRKASDSRRPRRPAQPPASASTRRLRRRRHTSTRRRITTTITIITTITTTTSRRTAPSPCRREARARGPPDRAVAARPDSDNQSFSSISRSSLS